MIAADDNMTPGARGFVSGELILRVHRETVGDGCQIAHRMKPRDAEIRDLAHPFQQSAAFARMEGARFLQNGAAQFFGQQNARHGGAVLTCAVNLPVARSMISTSLPRGVETCNTSLPASVVAETMRAPGAKVTIAAGPAGAGAILLDAARPAIKIRAWRAKPQMVAKRASTKSVLMIMTITQAVRRLVAGGRAWSSTGMSDTENSLRDHRTALAGADHAGWRLDRFLAAALPDFSRSRLQQLLEGKAVRLGEKTIRDANHRVKPGDSYSVIVPPTASAIPQGQDIPLAVVYEDKDLIVINKPPGLVVHPAAGNPDGTLVNALIAHCGEKNLAIGGEARPGIVHRLDKDTSGLLVAAKNERAMASLAKQFANHTIERVYNAILWGSPRDSAGLIESQIGRSQFDRKRMAVLRAGGKRAATRYKVIEKFGTPSQIASGRPFASLIECRLETGRTHQIRVHLTHLGYPLIGDAQYGRNRAAPKAKSDAEGHAFTAATQFPRQALHAFVLGFQHPSLHKTLRFEAPWPADFAELAKALRGLNKA